MDIYYFSDQGKTQGPHNLRELQELYSQNTINTQTPILRVGESEWSTLRSFCDLNAPECQPLDLDLDIYLPRTTSVPTNGRQSNGTSTGIEHDCRPDVTESDVEEQVVDVRPTEEEAESVREDDEDLRTQRVTRHQLLSEIREGLDNLWACQREAIIARVKDETLDKSYEATRRKNSETYETIKHNAIEYWRRSGLLRVWIGELTWREHDFTFRLRGKSEAEKYDSLQGWLQDRGLSEFAGCYCFKKGREYIYVGQAGILCDRIKQHEKKTYFTYSTSVRVVIPKNKRQINQLERLLILAHQPSENCNAGVTGRTRVDECLDFIHREIQELVNDF